MEAIMTPKSMQTDDLTTDDLKTFIRKTVQDVLDDYLEDPDASLSLRPKVQANMETTRVRLVSGQWGIPAGEVAKQFGLDWE
jgi:hypothetical protein